MAKRIYDDDTELFGDLEEAITNSLLTSVDRKVKKIYKGNVKKMYNSYDRTSYIPRYDKGGFLDEDNWESRVDETGDSFEYVMTNETLANGDNRGDRLDTYIEEGKYNWSRKPGKRPVYEWTQEEVDSSSEVENAIYKDLKSWL
ncbi:hypothetical protein [Paraclostridium bifermentans]|uniref:hypothetical protein n=1 Tax=Paraclostridium bifermentans TaxID=1490 RepID=UPI00189FAF2B|nr:hypothetical protein [Paraclostridium bifermentans]